MEAIKQSRNNVTEVVFKTKNNFTKYSLITISNVFSSLMAQPVQTIALTLSRVSLVQMTLGV